MSFLLDALGKADEDRRRAEVPELRTYRQSYRSPWRRVLSGLLIVSLLVLSFVAGYLLRPVLEPAFSRLSGPAESIAPSVTPVQAPVQTAPAQAPPVTQFQAPRPINAQEMTLPGIELEVISYAENPAARFAMINGLVLHEGDALQTGERLLVIERDAVILDRAGQAVRIGM